jgi:hypothetical protein
LRGPRGCLTNLVLLVVVAPAFVWAVMVALHPWALHIGGRSTPLLYWHGSGTVTSKDGKTYPLYVSFWPGRPGGATGGGRREGKIISSRLTGTGWLCIAPGNIERMTLGGTLFGGYTDASNSLFAFRLLEWRKPFSINPPNRGYFDLAGMWSGQDLVLNRPNEQGLRLNTGPFIDHATTTLRWSSYGDFESACRNGQSSSAR